MSAPNENERLADLLESFGGSLQSFKKLRRDSYEHALAAQSLARLEQLYSVCLAPGAKPDEVREMCPPWPPGTPLAGQYPSAKLLYRICTRFNTEVALNSLAPISNFLQKLRKKAQSLPIGQQDEVLDTIMTLVAQDLISERTKGNGIDLNAVDRLQNQKGLRQAEIRLKQNDRKIEDLEKRTALQQEKMDRAKREIEQSLMMAKSKGGLTLETLAQIEAASKLL